MEAVQGIFGILLLIGFIAGIMYLRYLMSKGANALAKTVNQKVLFKDKYQKGVQLVSQPLVFRTSLSISDIMRQLMAHVTTVETPLGFRGGVYQLSCDEQGIVYAFGSKLKPQIFVAKINFSNNGAETEGVFKITNWIENSGLIVGQEAIDKLCTEIQGAFMKIDRPGNVDVKSKNIHCGNCGIENLASAKFCKNCGNQIIETRRRTTSVN